MVVANIWTVEEILKYLSEYSGTITLAGGSPFLKLPTYPVNRWGRQVDRKRIADEILPHLKGRKRELLEWCAEQEDADLRRVNEEVRKKEREAHAAKLRQKALQSKLDSNQESRASIVYSMRETANIHGKRLWWMTTPPHETKMGRNGLIDIPDTATWLAIEGGSHWTPLPKIVPDPEPKRRKKDNSYVWGGG